MKNLGLLFHRGDILKQDYELASTYYSVACNIDAKYGCTELGLLYENGLGVQRDYEKAKLYYEKAVTLTRGLVVPYLEGFMLLVRV